MSDAIQPPDRWEQLNKCPECGDDMERAAQVGEQIGLYYRCARHGRFRYSWDKDALEPVPESPDSSR
ncbi:MAG TPA: hypothetical protein VGL62_01305 [Vicinamibacterales bacterium]